jgi:hypothetical protein
MIGEVVAGMASDPHDDLRKELAAEGAGPELAPIASAMAANSHLSSADHLEMFRLVAGVRAGSAWNGYTAARLMGLSREEARAHPATAQLLAIRQWLGGEYFIL